MVQQTELSTSIATYIDIALYSNPLKPNGDLIQWWVKLFSVLFLSLVITNFYWGELDYLSVSVSVNYHIQLIIINYFIVITHRPTPQKLFLEIPL